MVLTSGLCVGKEWGVGGSFLRDLHDSDDVAVRGEGGPVRRRNVLDLQQQQQQHHFAHHDGHPEERAVQRHASKINIINITLLTMVVTLRRGRSKGMLARPLRHVAGLVLFTNLGSQS